MRGSEPDALIAANVRRSLTLAAMSVSQAMILLDVTIVNVGLPAIQRELHAPPGNLEWVISSYALVLATLTPLGGTLGDRFGRKRVFIGGLAVFTLASLGCALAATDVALIAFRACQGVGGAIMSALTLSILSAAYPADRCPGAIGVWAAAGGLGFGLGPVAGGILLSRFDWSSIFWVNVPVGVLGVVVAVLAVRESRDPVARPFDVAGVCLCGAGLFGVTLGLVESANTGWISANVLWPLAGGLACLAGFALWERRARSPMVPSSLWRARGFPRASGVYLLSSASQAGLLFFVTLLFQDVKGWSALGTGLSWLLMNIPFFMLAQLAGRLRRRFRAQTLIGFGCLIAGVSAFGLSRITATTPFALTGLWYVLYGIGYGLFVPVIASVAMANVPPGAYGIASGVLNASRQVGTSVGLAVLGSIGVSIGVGAAASRRHAGTAAFFDHAAFVHGYEIAVGAAALILIVASAIAYAGLRPPPRRDARSESGTG